MTQSKPNKPGRKPISAKQSVEMRAAILSAAERLFIEKGYQGVSMRALAGELELSPMSLYRYLDNKRSILIHLWADIFTKLFVKCRKSATKQSTSEKSIAAYGVCFVQYWIENRQNYIMVYGEIDRPETSESFFADSELVQIELEYLVSLFMQAGAAEDKCELACQQYLCALHGICHSIITIPEMNWASPAELLSGLIRGILTQQAA